MNKRDPLFISFLALAILSLLYWGISSLKAKNERADAEAEAARLAVLSLEGASEISCASPTAELTFTEADGVWRAEHYDGWPLDQNAIETLEYDLINLKAVRVLDEPGALAEYGLDVPEYTVTITDPEGGEHILAISGEDVNGNLYAALEGDGRVFTIAPSLVDSLGKDILSYVDYEQLPHPAESSVTAITLEQGGDVWQYTRVETAAGESADESADAEAEPEYTWECLKNGEAAEPVNENVASAIYQLAQLSFSSCVAYDAEPAALESYGLGEPYAVVTVSYNETGEDGSYSLTVGDSFGETSAESAYVMLGGSKAVTVCAYTGLSDAISLLRSA